MAIAKPLLVAAANWHALARFSGRFAKRGTALLIDIGGANLKLADGQGYAASYTFSMWKDSRQLAQELRTLIAEAPESDHLAVTMTGELADCFETRTDGVKFILQAVKDAADARHTRV